MFLDLFMFPHYNWGEHLWIVVSFSSRHILSFFLSSFIDSSHLGNLSALLAQAAKGGVDCILNDASNRQTATYVSVQGKQRYIGDAGAALQRSNIKNTVSCMKLLVGRKYEEEDVQTELKRHAFKHQKMPHGGVGICMMYNDEEIVVSAEHVLGKFLCTMYVLFISWPIFQKHSLFWFVNAYFNIVYVCVCVCVYVFYMFSTLIYILLYRVMIIFTYINEMPYLNCRRLLLLLLLLLLSLMMTYLSIYLWMQQWCW